MDPTFVILGGVTELAIHKAIDCTWAGRHRDLILWQSEMGVG